MATAFTTVGYFAVAVFALGMTSLATDSDVVAVGGLGPLPGTLAVAVSTAAYALSLRGVLRARRPSFVSSVWVGFLTVAGYTAALWLTALPAGAARATAAAGQAVVGWVVPLLALVALAAAWVGIALRRTRARRPRWPWERDDG